MDYSKILEDLKQASSFDLYRLRVAIDHQLETPQRSKEIKRHLKIGQLISYFDNIENRLIEARIIKFKRTRLLVENIYDKRQWNIPFYWINLDRVDTNIATSTHMGLEKSQLKVGDTVRFQDRQNNDIYGEIIRLNQKSVTLKTDANVQWRVAYGFLHLVIDGVQGYPNLIEGEVVD